MAKRRPDNIRLVLVLTYVVTGSLSGSHNDAGLDLECTNNCEWTTCHLDRQNCTEYTLVIQSVSVLDTQHCSLLKCEDGRCCCTVEMMQVLGEVQRVTVWRRDRMDGSQFFDVKNSMKPDRPQIFSVIESNGNIEIQWQTNMTGTARDSLISELTYFKKGAVKKECIIVNQTTVNGQYYHKLQGRHLEASATYVVSVRSITKWSGKMSDSSPEWEFKTPASYDLLLLSIIISLSVAIVILSGAIYFSFVRLKAKWWDTVTKYPYPKLDFKHSIKQEVLKPARPIISSISVDPLILHDGKLWLNTSLDSKSGGPQHSSGHSTGSSGLSYVNTEPPNIKAGIQDALCKAFPNISPVSQLISAPLMARNQDNGLLSTPISPSGGQVNNSCSTVLLNKTYSIISPIESVADNLTVQSQTEVFLDSVYHSCQRETVDSQEKPFSLHLPSGGSSFMPIAMSYQQCNQDSGRLSEDSGLQSTSSEANTTCPSDTKSRPDAECAKLVGNETKLNGISGENIPSFSQTPTKSQSLLLVNDEYQRFQTVVGHPDVFLSDQIHSRPEEHGNKCQEEPFIQQNLQFTTAPGFSNHCPSSQIPFLPIWSAQHSASVIVDSDYQSLLCKT